MRYVLSLSMRFAGGLSEMMPDRQKGGVSKFRFILFFVLFFKTKPRLSQAGALSYHKNLVFVV